MHLNQKINQSESTVPLTANFPSTKNFSILQINILHTNSDFGATWYRN